MEKASLTSAHTHVRNASRSPESALEQHTAAADDFARTAQDVQDAEALRILNLLEQEHRRLVRLVQPRSQSHVRAVSLDESAYDAESATSNDPKPQTRTSSPGSKVVATIDTPKRQSSPVLERRQVRSTASSIANNLASARGIPTAPHRHARQRGADDKSTHKSPNEQHGSAVLRGPMNVDRTTAQQVPGSTLHHGQDTSDEDPFHKFYSGFEGLWSRLSAPLAFAGLPLVPEIQKEHGLDQPEGVSATNRRRGDPAELPSIDSIYSKAAMRAIKEDRGPVGYPQESFYVVPDQLRHGTSQISQHDEEDLFEDARELPQITPPSSNRTMPKTALIGGSGKTIEELELENASLKTLTDNLSKRLYMWEKNAQNQTAAMQQSIRTLQPVPTSSDLSNTQQVNDASIKQLEEQLRATQKEVDQQNRENAKLKTVIVRYRERWDKLKEGARVRREGSERSTQEQPLDIG